jgi:hypothetical protein
MSSSADGSQVLENILWDQGTGSCYPLDGLANMTLMFLFSDYVDSHDFNNGVI